MISCVTEIRKISLPRDLILEILKFCSWSRVNQSVWYIVASKFDPTKLARAKQLDVLSTFLSNDDEDDMMDLFKSFDCFDYVNHIRNNKTI
jgi:hypothetical protein